MDNHVTDKIPTLLGNENEKNIYIYTAYKEQKF